VVGDGSWGAGKMNADPNKLPCSCLWVATLGLSAEQRPDWQAAPAKDGAMHG